MRNTGNEYDLLIYVANWPVPRRKVWDILLQARALENISYVCGVNRIGKDGNSFSYNGGSAIYSYKGEMQIQVPVPLPKSLQKTQKVAWVRYGMLRRDNSPYRTEMPIRLILKVYG